MRKWWGPGMLSSRVSAEWRCIWRTGVSRGMDRLAESARFPRQDVPQGTLYAPAQNRQNRPPNGLQGPRSSRAGWSVRSWPAASATPAAGWWALRRCFPARCARSERRSRRKLTPVLAGLARSVPAHEHLGREAVPSPTGRASPRWTSRCCRRRSTPGCGTPAHR